MTPTFLKAFKEVLRKEILNKNKVELEGLGSFEVVHRKQYQKKNDDGSLVMMPPADVVEFQSDLRGTNEN